MGVDVEVGVVVGEGIGVGVEDGVGDGLGVAVGTEDSVGDGDGEADTLSAAGILWMQGESDAGEEQVAAQYEANLKRLMDLIRAALREDDIPVVIGRISDSGKDDYEKENANGKVWTFGDVVRQAQADFVKNDENAAIEITTDGYGYSDPWHYDSAGYIDLGKKFAEAVHQQNSRAN